MLVIEMCHIETTT